MFESIFLNKITISLPQNKPGDEYSKIRTKVWINFWDWFKIN